MIIRNNLVDFEIYAGVYTGYLIAYLEELSGLIYGQLAPHNIDNDAKDYHPGYGIIKAWISRANHL